MSAKGADSSPAARYDHDEGTGRLGSRYFTQITRQTAHLRSSEPHVFSRVYDTVSAVSLYRWRRIRFLAGAAQAEDLRLLSSSITADVEKPTPLRSRLG
jgi:hypothetical protein